MKIINIFSKRQKQLRGEAPDVYSYATLPTPLRVQIVHILHDGLGNENSYQTRHLGTRRAYELVVDSLCREYGVFHLGPKKRYGDRDYFEELINFVLQEESYEKVLDAVELSFRLINGFARKWEFMHRNDASASADAAIEELNVRFQEHGVGYRFEEGEIVRIDSELIHADVVKPALQLLRAPEYQGAQAEFLKAHEHHRHGRTKDVLSECLKSLESVMKSVCAKRQWIHEPNATSKALIQVLFDKGLVPSFWNQHFSALRATLEGGVPTARNRLGGHGQGTDIVDVPQHLAAYVLHQTASAIVFIVQAEKVLP